MSYPTLFATILAIVCGIYYFLENTSEESLGFAIILALIWSIIAFSEFWAKYVLNLGIMESLAKDSKTPEFSEPAITLFGWIGLLLLSYFTFF